MVSPLLLDEEVRARIDRLEIPFGPSGIDPYGISKKHLRVFLSALAVLYRNYFQVASFGIEHVPAKGRAMLIGNHSGGVAIDGAMVIASTFLEMNPPRLAEGMAEKFLARMPFASMWTSRVGQFTGLPEHAVRLLEDDRLLMVFPEGARGTAKLYWERNTLVGFGTGFMRLALQTKTPIIPFAFVGGGDAVPTVWNAKRLGRMLGAPYIPFTPYVLPLPLPVPLEVHYGAPMVFDGTGAEDDATIERYVGEVKDRITALLDGGRRWKGRLLPAPEPEAQPRAAAEERA